MTTLFNTAPDLLEDFKQFLPESAAQAKAVAKAAEDAAALAGASHTPQPAHAVRGDQKLPPVGNFPPPSTSKDGRKRTRPPTTTTAVTMAPLGDGSGARSNITQVTNANKRTKISHNARIPVDEMPAVSPTLTPNLALPQPMPPGATSSSQQAEVAFFDKVKKYLSNKQAFAEFLKLCNLFSQDLIDRNVLVHKVSNFIGTNLELMDFFKKFVAYTGPEEVIENRPRAPTGRVALSNCRGLGPSYRLLPKRVRLFNLFFSYCTTFLYSCRLFRAWPQWLLYGCQWVLSVLLTNLLSSTTYMIASQLFHQQFSPQVTNPYFHLQNAPKFQKGNPRSRVGRNRASVCPGRGGAKCLLPRSWCMAPEQGAIPGRWLRSYRFFQSFVGSFSKLPFCASHHLCEEEVGWIRRPLHAGGGEEAKDEGNGG